MAKTVGIHCFELTILHLIVVSDKQHIALGLAMGDLTPCPDIVDAVLAPVDGGRRRVLDIGMYYYCYYCYYYFLPSKITSQLGCGTGIWYTNIVTYMFFV